jgi:hypothetical protein
VHDAGSAKTDAGGAVMLTCFTSTSTAGGAPAPNLRFKTPMYRMPIDSILPTAKISAWRFGISLSHAY